MSVSLLSPSGQFLSEKLCLRSYLLNPSSPWAHSVLIGRLREDGNGKFTRQTIVAGFSFLFLNTLYSKCERLTYIHICLNWKMRHQQCTEIWIETETYKQLLVGMYQQSDVGWVEVQVMLQQGRPEQGGFSFKTGFETMLQYNIELTLQHAINHRNSVPVYLCSESTYCHTQLHYQTSKACSRNNQCHQEYNYHLNIKCVSDYVF